VHHRDGGAWVHLKAGVLRLDIRVIPVKDLPREYPGEQTRAQLERSCDATSTLLSGNENGTEAHSIYIQDAKTTAIDVVFDIKEKERGGG
jgi:hypothetical protein